MSINKDLGGKVMKKLLKKSKATEKEQAPKKAEKESTHKKEETKKPLGAKKPVKKEEPKETPKKEEAKKPLKKKGKEEKQSSPVAEQTPTQTRWRAKVSTPTRQDLADGLKALTEEYKGKKLTPEVRNEIASKIKKNFISGVKVEVYLHD
jgi:hypothetical protein